MRPGRKESKSTPIKNQILRILAKRGEVGFTALYNDLQNLSEDLRPGSYSTLILSLRKLADAGWIEYDLHKRKWKLTTEAQIAIRGMELTELVAGKLKPSAKYEPEKLHPTLRSLVTEELEPGWMDAANEFISKAPVKQIAADWGWSEAEVTQLLRSFVEKTKSPFWYGWYDYSIEMIQVFRYMWIYCQLLRAINVTKRLNEKEIEQISQRAVEFLGRLKQEEWTKDFVKYFFRSFEEKLEEMQLKIVRKEGAKLATYELRPKAEL